MPVEELELDEREKELLKAEREIETSFQENPGGDEDTITASEIEYYIHESDVLGNIEAIEFLNEEGFDMEDFSAGNLHAPFTTRAEEMGVDWEFGQEMYEIGLLKLQDFAEQELSVWESLKVDLMRAAASLDHNDYEAISALHSYFSEDGIDVDKMEAAFVEIEEGDLPQVTDEFMDEYWDDLGEGFWTGPELMTKAFALDTVKTLQRKALAKEDIEEYAEKCNEFERFFSRASPANQGRLVETADYTVAPVETRRGIKNLGLNTYGSCLFTDPENYDFDSKSEMYHNHPLEEAFMMWNQDPGTVYHAIGKNGDLKGYIRAFLMEDSDGAQFAGIDTIEVPKSGGLDVEDVEEDFSSQSDIISAGVFGAVPYYFNLGVDYVAGREARVSYGPRQSYGNTRKSIEYRKIGDTVPYYSAYRGDDWKGAGWLGYHDEGEAEVRGFRTEPGWHSTDNAYILMENPRYLPE